MQKFTVTDAHIKLLKRVNVIWEDGEFGAPAIDCKRPYGSSSVYQDIAEILSMPEAGEDERYSPEQYNHMQRVHKETQMVLQIFLATGQMSPGNYVAEDYTNEWRKQ